MGARRRSRSPTSMFNAAKITWLVGASLMSARRKLPVLVLGMEEIAVQQEQ